MDRINSNNCIEFGVAKPEDYIPVLQFVRKFYYEHEPMSTSYIHDGSPDEDDIEFSMSFLLQGMAVIANDRLEDRLVGVSIANSIYPGYTEELLLAAEKSRTRKWRDSLKLLAHLQQANNILKQFNVCSCYDIEILAVHPDYRGRRIGARLFEEQFERARILGYSLASADCTSFYSAQTAFQVGMECIGRLAYSNYKNEQGVQLFKPEPPHLEIQSFVKKL
ncbi:arylalkylamine N-acetyltransferase-like 2 [Toxorhynchites rutilus septentrionalis]|uniref:arylalkylamine N-acetyltransferase-like 2 n=1 Tax=Toxorhynchites rutilus septentrionalis TaxID=329112 RepID=UPI002478CDC3|nr:arylalkylamine N-acetyltransferase-like 2 [Toxorhynchites rutilus septentrionalis]